MNISDHGTDNEIDCNVKDSSINLVVRGSRNRIIVAPDVRLGQGDWQVNGDENRIVIGSEVRIGSLRIICQDCSLISIGDRTTIEQAYILARDGCAVQIGMDCMISFQVDIRTSDAHGIFDRSTGEWLNPPGDVTLEDHVWLSQGVIVSKNTRIQHGAMIGSRSYVQNCIIPADAMAVGAPCRVVREEIRWTRSIDGK